MGKKFRSALFLLAGGLLINSNPGIAQSPSHASVTLPPSLQQTPYAGVSELSAETSSVVQPEAVGGSVLQTGTTPSASNPYAGDLLTRQRLTGDWWSTRSALADRGLTFDLFATQFYQGVASGGNEQQFRYGGKLDYLFNVDGGKLGLWQGLFVNLHAETRFGRSTNEIDGLIAPSNIPLNFPEPGANITSITGLKIT
jgi:porin